MIFIRRHKLPFWEVADVAAIAITGLWVWSHRLLLCRLLLWSACDLPWAVTFPATWAANFHRLWCPGIPQLYQRSWALYSRLCPLVQERRRFAGQSFLLYLVLYGVGRSLIEILRINPTVFGTPLTVAQFTGLVLAVLAGIAYPILRRRTAYPRE